MPLALVIFDCDGVLVDSEAISGEVLIGALAEVGVAVDFAHVRRHFIGRSFPTVAASLRAGGHALPDGFEATYRARVLAAFEARLRPTPGVADFVSRLRVPACVATSSSPPRLARTLALAGLAAAFGPRRFTASEVARGKPAPDLFLHAAACMGAAPEGCLVIEDSAPGLEAAAAAGMRSILYAGGSHHGPDKGLGGSEGRFESWAAVARGFPELLAPQAPGEAPRRTRWRR